MSTRMKKKTAPSAQSDSRSELVGRSLRHLNRSVRHFTDGLQERLWTLQERLLIEPVEAAAWVLSKKLHTLETKVFGFIDEKIHGLDDSRNRKLDEETALERFDGEGGAMLPTLCEGPDCEDEVAAKAAATDKKTTGKSSFEPSLSH